MGPTRIVGSRELQRSPQALLTEVATGGQTCYITERGKAKAVLMDIARYHALMDMVEEGESLGVPERAEGTHQLASVRSILERAGPRVTRTRR